MFKYAGVSDCRAVRGSYGNGNLAIRIMSESEGPIATATVNLGDKLHPGEAFIKDYSENVGMLDALIKEGIVVTVLGRSHVGYTTVPFCLINLGRLSDE